MRSAVFGVLVAVVSGGLVLAQAPPAAQTPPKPPVAAPAPAQTPAQVPPPQAPRPAARPAATSTITVQVTDTSGLPLGTVQVSAQGPVSREGTTADDGTVRFATMRAGAYRLRLAREGSITLERDVTVRAGEPLLVDVSLSAAPAAPKPVEAPRPAPAAPDRTLGPAVEPKMTPIPTFLEKNFVGREGRKDSPLGCTQSATSILIQLREALLNQTHDDVDEWIYVVAGEGTLRLGTSEQRLLAGTFALIPHTVAHGILPVGRNPLIFVSIMSGYRTC
jgi:mannose-6-phosphate isomerase-like protein (cupin superfamily)